MLDTDFFPDLLGILAGVLAEVLLGVLADVLVAFLLDTEGFFSGLVGVFVCDVVVVLADMEGFFPDLVGVLACVLVGVLAEVLAAVDLPLVIGCCKALTLISKINIIKTTFIITIVYFWSDESS